MIIVNIIVLHHYIRQQERQGGCMAFPFLQEVVPPEDEDRAVHQETAVVELLPLPARRLIDQR